MFFFGGLFFRLEFFPFIGILLPLIVGFRVFPKEMKKNLFPTGSLGRPKLFYFLQFKIKLGSFC